MFSLAQPLTADPQTPQFSTLEEAQTTIYQFLSHLVKNQAPEAVLEEFQKLFIYSVPSAINHQPLREKDESLKATSF